MRLTMSALLVIVRPGLIRLLSAAVVGRQADTTDEQSVRRAGKWRGGEELEEDK